MNRFISVPEEFFISGNPPEEAVKLAKIFSLEIRKNKNSKKIEIKSEPQTKTIEYSPKFVLGKIWHFNIIDEFLDMSCGAVLLINEAEYLPKIKEKHSAKFRIRITEPGDKLIIFKVNGLNIYSNTITEEK